MLHRIEEWVESEMVRLGRFMSPSKSSSDVFGDVFMDGDPDCEA